MKITFALLASFIATASAVTSGGCTVAHVKDGNIFALFWNNIPSDRIGNICARYEEALNRHAGQIGNKNTRVKSYECTRLPGQNTIRVAVKMDKQSCLTQSDVLVPALHNALDFSTNVPDHQCRRDINAGKC